MQALRLSSLIRTNKHIFNLSSVRAFSYPAHIVVGMPSLSPTMATGTIGKWVIKVGDKVSPGDAMAEVETDKTSVVFEAQDEFFIAKLLVEAGAEVKVGDPIMVTVDDVSLVPSFKDFALSGATKAAAPVAPATPAAPTKPIEAPKPVVPAPTPAPTPAKAVEAPKPAAAPVTKPTEAPKASGEVKKSNTLPSWVWGSGVVKSALSKKIATEQQQYIEKYGRSCHVPLKTPEKKAK